MSTPNHSLPTLARNDAFDRKLRTLSHGHMNIRRFRYLEFLLAFAIIASGVFGILEGGDPTTLTIVTTSIAGLLAGVKVTEILETYQAGQDATQDGGDDG
jgi:hypothetical protein